MGVLVRNTTHRGDPPLNRIQRSTAHIYFVDPMFTTLLRNVRYDQEKYLKNTFFLQNINQKYCNSCMRTHGYNAFLSHKYLIFHGILKILKLSKGLANFLTTKLKITTKPKFLTDSM